RTVGEGYTPSLVVDGYSQQYVSLPPDEGAQGFPGVMAKALLVSRTRMRKKTGPGDCLVSHVPLDPFRQSGSFTQAVNGWRGSESSVEQLCRDLERHCLSVYESSSAASTLLGSDSAHSHIETVQQQVV
ncbi:hypothetical protein CTAM01_03897, partial [Colletotrichum tamarilloi]